MKIIFAGGGTAGHVNPALAAAGYIKSREECEIYFSGAKGGIEEKLVKQAGYELFAFPISGLSRTINMAGVKQNYRALKNAMAAVAAAKKILGELKPDIVVGTGGYASFPMVYAAQRLKIKTALLEVNATPGVATKKLAPKADCLMISFEETARVVNAKRIVLTGSPVREEILNCRNKSYDPIFDNGKPTVVSFWGSVGAQYMNQKMVDFIKIAVSRQDFNLLHAAGSKHIENMKKELATQGRMLENAPNIDLREYITEMDKALSNADLVICRAGGTLAELCAAGRASIVVPSPYVAENHQEKNARVLERAGACVVMTEQESSGEKLYDLALELLQDKPRLEKMEQCALKKAQPDALKRIYDTVKLIVNN